MERDRKKSGGQEREKNRVAKERDREFVSLC